MLLTRPSVPADVPAQRQLWQLAFGDDDALSLIHICTDPAAHPGSGWPTPGWGPVPGLSLIHILYR